MSVCVMKKLTVLAPQRDADRLVRRLMRLRCAELSSVPLGDLPDGGTLLRYDCDTARAEAERRVADVTAAMPLLDAYTAKAMPWNKKPVAVTTEEFRSSGRFDKARETVAEVLSLEERRTAARNSIVRRDSRSRGRFQNGNTHSHAETPPHRNRRPPVLILEIYRRAKIERNQRAWPKNSQTAPRSTARP